MEVADKELRSDFKGLYPRLAAGLAGNGSECFGFDDELSRDHDWGVDFYIWTLEPDRRFIKELDEWKNDLYRKTPPGCPRIRSDYGARIGAMTCGDFFSGLIGVPEGPKTLHEWLRVPEANLAMAVNGDVFIDGPGLFTSTRRVLLGYYPEDLRRKRIAAKCMALAQTGQCNHERTWRRGDWVTLHTVLSRFVNNAIALVFLLNKVFLPYYKWAFRALGGLPLLGEEAARLLLDITKAGGLDDSTFSIRQQRITELCGFLANELRAQGLSDSEDWFLAAHGEAVARSIEDNFLRNLPPQHEI